jgi:hypothetical protein
MESGALVATRAQHTAALPVFLMCITLLWSAIHVQLGRWEATRAGIASPRRLLASSPRLALEPSPAAQPRQRRARVTSSGGAQPGGFVRAAGRRGSQAARAPPCRAPLLLRPVFWVARTLVSPLGALLVVRL